MAIVNGVIEENKPIGGEVFTFFGIEPHSDGKYYWGDIPQNRLINAKSKHKPVQYDGASETKNGVTFGKMTQLTPDMRRSVNYGHNYQVYNSAIAAIRGVAARTNFPYVRCTSWFRIADLWGYNHGAADWTSSQPAYNTVSKGASLAIQVSGIDEILSLGAFTSRGLNSTALNFGFLMSQSPFSSTQSQVYFACCTNYVGGETLADIERLAINTNKMALGTWYIYPVLTTANYSQDVYALSDKDEGGEWFPLPYCNTANFTVAQSGEDNLLEKYIVCERVDTDVRLTDPANLVFEIGYMTVVFANSSSVEYTLDVSVSSQSPNYGNLDWSGTVTVPAGGEGYVEHSYTDKEGNLLRFGVGSTPVDVTVTYRLTTENKTYTGNKTFTIYE